jgi:DNA topoisomerase-1
MTPAKFENIIIRFSNNDNKFYTYIKKMIFDGYRKIYNPEKEKDKQSEFSINSKFPKVNEIINIQEAKISEHTSLPPPRYTQASLIKALDDAGVGRPSTFKSMANMSLQRGYAKLENKSYVMNKSGNDIIVNLQKYFPNIVDEKFTSEMEEHLDEISHKHEN